MTILDLCVSNLNLFNTGISMMHTILKQLPNHTVGVLQFEGILSSMILLSLCSMPYSSKDFQYFLHSRSCALIGYTLLAANNKGYCHLTYFAAGAYILMSHAQEITLVNSHEWPNQFVPKLKAILSLRCNLLWWSCIQIS